MSPARASVRIVGPRQDPDGHAIRDFLTRIDQEYRWIDPEVDGWGAGQVLLRHGLGDAPTPVVVIDDEIALAAPTLERLADALGIRYAPSRREYDLIVVGAGPAGLAAAVYGASDGLRVAVAERFAPGGQAGTTSRIENYFGLDPDAPPMTGARLARIGGRQAEGFGAELLILRGVVGGRRVSSGRQMLELAGGDEIEAHAVIVATGVEWRRLDVPGLEELVGHGVYYGAGRSEAARLRGQHVVLVGAGNSAAQAALNFAEEAERVTMLVRGAALGRSASAYLVERITAHERIDVRLHSRLTEVHADGRLREITVADAGGAEARLRCDGLFVAIGGVAQTEWALDGGPRRDEAGFLITGPDLLVAGEPPEDWPLERPPQGLESTLPGFFVAGDVRHGSTKRVASAVGEGSMAVAQVHRHLEELRTS